MCERSAYSPLKFFLHVGHLCLGAVYPFFDFFQARNASFCVSFQGVAEEVEEEAHAEAQVVGSSVLGQLVGRLSGQLEARLGRNSASPNQPPAATASALSSAGSPAAAGAPVGRFRAPEAVTRGGTIGISCASLGVLAAEVGRSRYIGSTVAGDCEAGGGWSLVPSRAAAACAAAATAETAAAAVAVAVAGAVEAIVATAPAAAPAALALLRARGPTPPARRTSHRPRRSSPFAPPAAA
eukprot:scaffold117806_cov63-Phaeocystis_antarctica.AAC.3